MFFRSTTIWGKLSFFECFPTFGPPCLKRFAIIFNICFNNAEILWKKLKKCFFGALQYGENYHFLRDFQVLDLHVWKDLLYWYLISSQKTPKTAFSWLRTFLKSSFFNVLLGFWTPSVTESFTLIYEIIHETFDFVSKNS